jgi:hypothetical protein
LPVLPKIKGRKGSGREGGKEEKEGSKEGRKEGRKELKKENCRQRSPFCSASAHLLSMAGKNFHSKDV